jgi:hypothetical protein
VDANGRTSVIDEVLHDHESLHKRDGVAVAVRVVLSAAENVSTLAGPGRIDGMLARIAWFFQQQ